MPDVSTHPDHETASQALAAYTSRLAREAVRARNRFLFVVTGGSTPKRLYELLAADAQMPWAETHLFWSDERYVPHADPASNTRLIEETVRAHAPIPDEHVHRVPYAAGQTPEAAAAAYDATLRSFFPDADRPAFDLVLLGMGDDGHIASLFPDAKPWTVPDPRWAVGVYGPDYRPPRERVSLTYTALNGARHTALLVTGTGKAPAVSAVLEGHPDAEHLPITYLRPDGELLWFLDEAAASGLRR